LGPISSLGTVIDGPVSSIEPLAFNQQSITALPLPPSPTSAPTAAPTSKPAQVCIDATGWKDKNGNGCSFYSTLSGVDRSGFAASSLCNSYGVDPSLAASGTGCGVFTTQTSCENYGVRSLCSFINGKCTDKPIVAWQACCDCGGGVLTDATLPPTLAPTAAPTSPTAAPTQAPVAVKDQVLGISGLVSLDTSPLSSNRVKLYMYRLTYFTNTDAKDAIEEVFGGSLPAPIGQYPKFNSTLGKFESIPNAVVNSPNVPNYGNFEFATERVDGLTGVYYLFLMYSCNGGLKKRYPLYTDRVIIPGTDYADPVIYFTEIQIDGTPTQSMFECLNFNFDCFGAALPSKFKENNKYTLTVPPKYTNGKEGTYNSCSLKLILEKESIEQNLLFMFLLSFFLGISNADNKDNVNKICPTYYADCVADSDCLQELESYMTNKNIGMQTDVDWGSDPTKSELESSGATFTKLGYLNACVMYKYYANIAKVIENKNNRFLVKSDQTCDFMKTYYEHCKVTTSDNNKQILQTMSQDEYDKYTFNMLMLEGFVAPFCLLQREGFKLDLDLSSFLKENRNIYPDGTTIPPELNEIYYGLNAYGQIQKQCTTNLP
jgi:hypothetical protein